MYFYLNIRSLCIFLAVFYSRSCLRSFPVSGLPNKTKITGGGFVAALNASKQFAKDEWSSVSVVGSSVWQSPRAVFELELCNGI